MHNNQRVIKGLPEHKVKKVPFQYFVPLYNSQSSIHLRFCASDAEDLLPQLLLKSLAMGVGGISDIFLSAAWRA